MTVQRAVSVVLPTYNESESLPVIVPRIVETLRDAGLDGEVIVVDDDSPDGTAEVAHGLAERYPVRVIHRTEDRGLAKAVIAGFAASEAEVCVVMDADGSHPVSALPGMVEMIRGDRADIVVGSRNVEGGGSRNWPLFSQLKSRFAAALTFGLTSMTDPTTGFMAIRRDRVAGLDLDPVGWKIVLETVVKASPARVAEVPIVFEDREYGESKQSLGVFLEYLEHLAKLYAFRYPSLVEFLKFCIVGVAGLTVDLTTVVALKESMGLDTRVCAAFGFTVAVSSNYLLNRLWTFRRARELPWLWSYLTYVGANLLGLSVRMVTVHLLMVLTTLDRGYGYVLSNAAGIALATIFNFLGAKYFAFDPDRLAFGSDALDRDVPSAPVRPALRRAAVALLSAVTLYTAVDSTALRALVTDDEGVNVVTARNIEHSTALLIRPSVYPGGRHDWVSEDMPALGNLPLFPALMSLADRIGGLAGMGLLPWGALCVIVLCTALTLSPHSPRAATYTAVLLGTSPVFLQQARRLEFEPVLTACCAAGMMVFARGTAARRPAVCMAGGALLGLGFLTKMWLVVPYVFAVCGFILVQTTVVRAREQRPLWLRRSVIGGAVGFALVATLHLLFVAAVSPQDFPLWVRNVYLGIISGEGVTGAKLGGAADSPARPLSYYPAILYRDHFHLLPLILFGLPALLRRTRAFAVTALAMAFGALLGLVALSVPAAKEPLYALPVVPLLYALAGTALAELEEDGPKHAPANRASVKAALTIAALSLLALGGSALATGRPGPSYLALHAAGMAAVAAVGFRWLARRQLGFALVGLAAVSALALVAYERVVQPPPVGPALAQALQPVAVTPASAYPSFAAERHELLSGYLGQAGTGWSDDLRAEVLAGHSPLRAYVLGPGELTGTQSRRLLDALSRAHRELKVAGAPGYRIFVRPEP